MNNVTISLRATISDHNVQINRSSKRLGKLAVQGSSRATHFVHVNVDAKSIVWTSVALYIEARKDMSLCIENMPIKRILICFIE